LFRENEADGAALSSAWQSHAILTVRNFSYLAAHAKMYQRRRMVVIYTILAFVPCFWIAIFILSWRDARHRPFPTEVPKSIERPIPRPRPMDYFTLVPIHWLIFLLVWPAFVASWIERNRR
jgi:hypothetical protein